MLSKSRQGVPSVWCRDLVQHDNIVWLVEGRWPCGVAPVRWRCTGAERWTRRWRFTKLGRHLTRVPPRLNLRGRGGTTSGTALKGRGWLQGASDTIIDRSHSSCVLPLATLHFRPVHRSRTSRHRATRSCSKTHFKYRVGSSGWLCRIGNIDGSSGPIHCTAQMRQGRCGMGEHTVPL